MNRLDAYLLSHPSHDDYDISLGCEGCGEVVDFSIQEYEAGERPTCCGDEDYGIIGLEER